MFQYIVGDYKIHSDWDFKGGAKLRVGNKLYKFADQESSLYGYNISAAMKVASHEIRSLNEVIECQVPGIHVPLTVLLTYCGHKVLVSAIIPIKDNQTLIYGSSDRKTFKKTRLFRSNHESYCRQIKFKGKSRSSP